MLPIVLIWFISMPSPIQQRELEGWWIVSIFLFILGARAVQLGYTSDTIHMNDLEICSCRQRSCEEMCTKDARITQGCSWATLLELVKDDQTKEVLQRFGEPNKDMRFEDRLRDKYGMTHAQIQRSDHTVLRQVRFLHSCVVLNFLFGSLTLVNMWSFGGTRIIELKNLAADDWQV